MYFSNNVITFYIHGFSCPLEYQKICQMFPNTQGSQLSVEKKRSKRNNYETTEHSSDGNLSREVVCSKLGYC